MRGSTRTAAAPPSWCGRSRPTTRWPSKSALERLAAQGHAIPATGRLRLAARTDLREFSELAAAGDLPGAYYKARHSLAAIRLIQRAHFDEATKGIEWLTGDPWLASFATLPEHYRFVTELASAPRGPNILPEGGCDDLQRMIAAGWKHLRHEQPNVTTAVDLSPQAMHSGGTGLRLQAVANDPKNKPGALEMPPMWVTTASVPVERGQLLEIQGWVRIVRPMIGSVDGLMVIDSLSGDPLAQRVIEPGDWKSFTMYRAVGRTGLMSLTFALTGLGEVWVDDVSVRVVARGAADSPQRPPAMPQPVGYSGRP